MQTAAPCRCAPPRSSRLARRATRPTIALFRSRARQRRRRRPPLRRQHRRRRRPLFSAAARLTTASACAATRNSVAAPCQLACSSRVPIAACSPIAAPSPLLMRLPAFRRTVRDQLAAVRPTTQSAFKTTPQGTALHFTHLSSSIERTVAPCHRAPDCRFSTQVEDPLSVLHRRPLQRQRRHRARLRRRHRRQLVAA